MPVSESSGNFHTRFYAMVPKKGDIMAHNLVPVTKRVAL